MCVCLCVCVCVCVCVSVWYVSKPWTAALLREIIVGCTLCSIRVSSSYSSSPGWITLSPLITPCGPTTLTTVLGLLVVLPLVMNSSRSTSRVCTLLLSIIIYIHKER